MNFRTKVLRYTFLSVILLFLLHKEFPAQIYLDSTKSVDVRVEDLLSGMTLDEKIGQMTQAERSAVQNNLIDIKAYYIGSLLSGGGSAPESNTAVGWADMADNFQKQAVTTRLKIPLLYGIDAVHGHNNVKDAVIFPHNIGMGCTRNPSLVKKAAQVTASEIIATGLHWTFAPCVAVVRNERWGRTYEGFGEEPILVSQMGAAEILGLQGDSLSGRSGILACAKHFLADGGTANGIDQGNAQLDEQTLRRIHLPSYIEAVKSNVGSIMASYSSWNGQKMHANKYLLTDVLKTELGFKGFIVSDWQAIDQLPGDYSNQVESSINAGVDMVMLPFNYQQFTSTLNTLVQQGKVSESRINDAVRRILKVKFQMGLFEHPYSDRKDIAKLGSDEHRQVARECVRQSLVLLKKKDNVLPLLKNNMKIHVAGKNANDIGNQCGGWTISWQGSSGSITKGTTILQAIKNTVGTSTVSHSADGSGVSGADIAVAVIGETPYAEGKGDRSDLGLSPSDITLVRNLKTANIPVVVILVSGRPMILNPILHYSDAILAAWLPGTEGQGVADVLFGDYQPSGLLSHSWPKDMAQIPINFGDINYSPLYDYGFGITSLANSALGSSPVFSSALVSVDGTILEVTFNKPMKDPSGEFSNFKVAANPTSNHAVTKAVLSSKDNTTIILSLNAPVKKGETVYLSYTEGILLSADGGKLKSFSSMEAFNLVNESNAFTIPGRIEAENYNNMSGIQTENTSDAGGGKNVGWIETGDWMDYLASIPAAGKYNFNFRIASQTEAGQIILKMADTTVSTLTLPVTGGWQVWQTVSSTANMTQGLKFLRVMAGKGGFNLNWFEVNPVTSIEKDIEIPGGYFLSQNYPNPFNPITSIRYNIPEFCSVKLAIYDLLGREVAVLVNEEQQAGSYTVRLDGASLGISSGVYLYKLTAGEYSSTRKLCLLK